MHVPASSPSPMLPSPWVIQKRRQEAEGIFTWEIQPASSEIAITPFLPGQFNMLYAFGYGEVPISISGPAHIQTPLIHTIRAAGAITAKMEGLQEGEMIGVRGPYGTPWPIERAKGHDILLLAGGIGLAPLRPVLYWIFQHREDFGHVSLLVGARQPKALLFQDELAAWEREALIRVDLIVDIGSPGWKGNVGLITQRIPHAPCRPDKTIAMLCGPEIMMHYGSLDLLKKGLPAENIYISMERNMKCAIGWCGHCQLGPAFVCKDGPVFSYPLLQPWLATRER